MRLTYLKSNIPVLTNMLLLVITFFALQLSPHSVHALEINSAEDYYHFTSKNDADRFNILTTQLRCLVCQNQNIADSNAPLANDLREQIYKKIQTGQSNTEIIDYMIARYGHFILYKPPVDGITLGLWFGPFLILIFAIGYLFYYLTSHSRKSV